MINIWNYISNIPITESNTIIFIIISILVVLATTEIISYFKNQFKSKKEIESEKPKELPESTKEVDLSRGQMALDYLDRLIKEKYQYYLYLDLLPIYLDRKIPEKNIISKTKEKIYVSIVGSLTRDVKQEILKYFTEKGIEIYVNEKILIYMNETDFQTAQKYTESFREMNVNDLDKLL
jgi:hypothetical protein